MAQSYIKAVEFYKLAADRGDADAQHYLTECEEQYKRATDQVDANQRNTRGQSIIM